MADFQINLIRDRVLPPPRRKLLFVQMTGYIVLCIVALVGVAYNASNKVFTLSRQQGQLDRLERELRARHPIKGDLLDFAGQTRQDVENAGIVLDALNQVLAARPDTARLLLGLSRHLPYGVYIADLSLDRGQQRLLFEVAVTDAPSPSVLTPDELIKEWSRDSLLADRITDLRSVASMTRRSGDKSVSIWQFSCKLARRGA